MSNTSVIKLSSIKSSDSDDDLDSEISTISRPSIKGSPASVKPAMSGASCSVNANLPRSSSVVEPVLTSASGSSAVPSVVISSTDSSNASNSLDSSTPTPKFYSPEASQANAVKHGHRGFLGKMGSKLQQKYKDYRSRHSPNTSDASWSIDDPSSPSNNQTGQFNSSAKPPAISSTSNSSQIELPPANQKPTNSEPSSSSSKQVLASSAISPERSSIVLPKSKSSRIMNMLRRSSGKDRVAKAGRLSSSSSFNDLAAVNEAVGTESPANTRRRSNSVNALRKRSDNATASNAVSSTSTTCSSSSSIERAAAASTSSSGSPAHQIDATASDEAFTKSVSPLAEPSRRGNLRCSLAAQPRALSEPPDSTTTSELRHRLLPQADSSLPPTARSRDASSEAASAGGTRAARHSREQQRAEHSATLFSRAARVCSLACALLVKLSTRLFSSDTATRYSLPACVNCLRAILQSSLAFFW